MSPEVTAAFLAGNVSGAVLTLLLAFAAFGLSVWRQGWSEGTEINGEALERNRKRSES